MNLQQLAALTRKCISPVLLIAGLLLPAGAHAVDKPKKSKVEAPIMSYTVLRQNGGILYLILNNTPWGEKTITIDTNPTNTTPGIRDEVPVAVSLHANGHSIDVEMQPGGKAVRSVTLDGKRLPQIKARLAPPSKPKK